MASANDTIAPHGVSPSPNTLPTSARQPMLPSSSSQSHTDNDSSAAKVNRKARSIAKINSQGMVSARLLPKTSMRTESRLDAWISFPVFIRFSPNQYPAPAMRRMNRREFGQRKQTLPQMV